MSNLGVDSLFQAAPVSPWIGGSGAWAWFVDLVTSDLYLRHEAGAPGDEGFERQEVIIPPDRLQVSSVRVTTRRTGAPIHFQLTVYKDGVAVAGVDHVDILPVAEDTWETFRFSPTGTIKGGDRVVVEIASKLNTGAIYNRYKRLVFLSNH